MNDNKIVPENFKLHKFVAFYSIGAKSVVATTGSGRPIPARESESEWKD